MSITQQTDEYLRQGYDLGSAIAAAVSKNNPPRDLSNWADDGHRRSDR